MSALPARLPMLWGYIPSPPSKWYAISALVAWMHLYPPWLPGMHTVGDAALGVPSPATTLPA